MKKLVYSLIIILAILPFRGLTQKTKSSWPELTSFHTLMAATFHPTEDGNFKPLRQKADSLFMAAKRWQASTIPADYNKEKTISTLNKLVSQCGGINAAVKATAADAKLKKMISSAHETFHTIVEKCKNPEK